jgi:L-ascorbate metabolism protein UlaG (beta-lactamase superfamily)
MRLRWLGWAGVELETGGATLVIDPLGDPGAVFAALGEVARGAPVPPVVAPEPGSAVAGLVTHLHRDHADAGALAAALRPGAPVFEPGRRRGEPLEDLALAQADHELAAAGLPRREVEPWTSIEAGPFTCTALPAADGIGDPQVAWLVEADGVRVLHLGDTLFHGWWWRMALRHGPFDIVLAPVNGATVAFPHRNPASPLPVVMGPEEAASAAALLGARLAVPIHDDGYDVPGVYGGVAGAAERFAAAAGERGVPVRRLAPGEALETGPRAS